MGCNGDCYQGRWCDCVPDTSDNQAARRAAYTQSALIVTLIGLIAWMIA